MVVEQQGLPEPPVAEVASEPEPAVAPGPEDEEERQAAPWSAHHLGPEGLQERSPEAQGPEGEQEEPEAQEARAARQAPEEALVLPEEPAGQQEPEA